MLSIKTTDVIGETLGGTSICNSEIQITGPYNRLLGEYKALGICFIDQILKDCEDHDMQLEFASHYTELVTELVSHLVEEVKNA